MEIALPINAINPHHTTTPSVTGTSWFHPKRIWRTDQIRGIDMWVYIIFFFLCKSNLFLRIEKKNKTKCISESLHWQKIPPKKRVIFREGKKFYVHLQKPSSLKVHSLLRSFLARVSDDANGWKTRNSQITSIQENIKKKYHPGFSISSQWRKKKNRNILDFHYIQQVLSH